MVKQAVFFLLCILSSSCFGDIISDLRPSIWQAAQTNRVDPIFMEAIMRHESANGKSKAARTRNNLAGIMRKRGGLRNFDSKEECVAYVGVLLSQYNQRGLKSIDSIGRRYAGSHKKSEWVHYVSLYMRQIRAGKWGSINQPQLLRPR